MFFYWTSLPQAALVRYTVYFTGDLAETATETTAANVGDARWTPRLRSGAGHARVWDALRPRAHDAEALMRLVKETSDRKLKRLGRAEIERLKGEMWRPRRAVCHLSELGKAEGSVPDQAAVCSVSPSLCV